MKRNFFLLVLLGFFVLANGQNVINNSFKENEKLKFVASYYMSGLWSDIAELKMEVSKVNTKNSSLFRLKCTANTYTSWDSFFKIRDLYESYVDMKTIKPFLFNRMIDEGGYVKSVKYVYKRKSGVVEAKIKRGNAKERSLDVDVSDDAYDLVSILYYVRNLDLDKLSVGQEIKVKLLVNSKYNVNEEIVTVKYKGIEKIKVDNYGKLKCHKLSINLKDEEVLKGKDSNNIWFTADENKVPVLIKAEIPVGSVQIRLVEMTGLRN